MNSRALSSANTTGGMVHPDDLAVILELMDEPEPEDKQETNGNKYLRLSKTLKAALLQKDRNISDSNSSTGHEIYSSLPTYEKAISGGDLLYASMSAASLGIAGLIKYKGTIEEDEFNIVLAVWSEFRKKRQQKPEGDTRDESRASRKAILTEAFDTLEKRISQFEQVFSIERAYEAKAFDEHRYDGLAREKGIWHAPEEHMQRGFSHFKKLRQNFSKAVRGLSLSSAWEGAVKFTAHMAVDAATKWTQADTYKDIAKGWRVMPSYFADFEFFSPTLREHKRTKSNVRELAKAARLEDHDIIPKLIEEGHLDKSKVEGIVKKRQAIRRDIRNGKLLNLGFAFESVFFLGHMGEGIKHGYEVAAKKIGESLMNADGEIELPAQFLNPDINRAVTEYLQHHAHADSTAFALGLNTYSILMVLGAYAFLGSNSYNLRERVRENRRYLAADYREVEEAYVETYGEPPKDQAEPASPA